VSAVTATNTTKTEGAAPAGASRPEGGPADALELVRRALGEIEYGSVLITIHQGEVVAVETSTKVRLKGT
jgi:hypothetical protein